MRLPQLSVDSRPLQFGGAVMTDEQIREMALEIVDLAIARYDDFGLRGGTYDRAESLITRAVEAERERAITEARHVIHMNQVNGGWTCSPTEMAMQITAAIRARSTDE